MLDPPSLDIRPLLPFPAMQVEDSVLQPPPRPPPYTLPGTTTIGGPGATASTQPAPLLLRSAPPPSLQDDAELHLALEPTPVVSEAEVVKCANELRASPEYLQLPFKRMSREDREEARTLLMGMTEGVEDDDDGGGDGCGSRQGSRGTRGRSSTGKPQGGRGSGRGRSSTGKPQCGEHQPACCAIS